MGRKKHIYKYENLNIKELRSIKQNFNRKKFVDLIMKI